MTTNERIDNLQAHIDTRISDMQKHTDARFDGINERFTEIHRILLQMQSDLQQFYFKLGQHDARLDNLEGK